MISTKPSTAGHSDPETVRTFTITHPFHPRHGQQLTLTTRRHNWGEDRVMYFNEAGKLHSIPTSWTSVAEEDAFQRASAGRSWFRVDDLLELATLTQALKNIQRKV